MWPVIDGGVVVVETCECAVRRGLFQLRLSGLRATGGGTEEEEEQKEEEEKVEEEEKEEEEECGGRTSGLLALCASGEVGGRGGRARVPVRCLRASETRKNCARVKKVFFVQKWRGRFARPSQGDA